MNQQFELRIEKLEGTQETGSEISSIISLGRTALEKSDEEQKTIAQNKLLDVLKEAVNNPDKYNIGLIKKACAFLKESGMKSEPLLEVGIYGLAKEKDLGKQEKKIAIVSRILDTLLDMEVADGSNLGMKFLAKGEIPDHIFLFFIKHLVSNGRLTKNTEKYLADKENIDCLRTLVAKYPNQFSTTIDTISQIEGYQLKDKKEEVLSALADLGTITPVVFKIYLEKDVADRKEFAQSVAESKMDLFKNVPINGSLGVKDKEVSAEMIYLTYRPIGMSFEKMKELLPNIQDRTSDLEELSFPDDGYSFTLDASHKTTLKEGQTLDLEKLSQYRNMLLSGEVGFEEVGNLKALMVRMAKAGTLNEKEIQEMLGLVKNDEFIANFIQQFETINSENVFSYLNSLKEIFGVYLEDNYKVRLEDFLSTNKDIENALSSTLSNQDRKSILVKKLGNRAEEIDWDDLNTKELAKLVSIFFESSILKPLKDDINKNIGKFRTQSNGHTGVLTRKNLKAYISKNVGSFFAKGSVGICTAEDIPLFNRPDHFHINVVEDEQFVRANIQAYVVQKENERILILRGFNPNSNFVEKIDVESFCENILEIGRKFQEDNGLDGVYITEQEDWHALSNREQVGKYLINKYHREDNKTPFSFDVSSSNKISNIYKI